MHTLKRRVEELEKACLALRHDREYKVEMAILSLRDEAAIFCRSFDAEQKGRPLTAAESAARQAYTRALEAECRSQPSSIGRVKPNPDFEKFLSMVAAQPYSEEVFKLAASGEL